MPSPGHQRRIVVVGGLAAGPSAAAKAKRVNPSADVCLIEAGETVSYGICESPYAIGGFIGDEEKLVSYSPDRLFREKGVTVRTQCRAESVSTADHTVLIRNLRSRQTEQLEYDRLVIATGAVSNRLGLPGEDARNAFHLRSRADTQAILGFLSSVSPRTAVIIGGGYVGVELAEAFRRRGLDVTMLLRGRLPLSRLELQTRERAGAELEQQGVHLITNVVVETLALTGDQTISHVGTNRGTFESGLVIIAAGVTPETGLARSAGIRIGATGAVAVDERQQTSKEGIYAAGDCAEVKHLVTGKPAYIPLATVASKAGWVAGENAAGGHAVLKGALRAIGVRIFGLEVGQVGLSSEEARSSGFTPDVASVTSWNMISMMPGSERITVTLISDRGTKRLLGANVYGGAGSALRANMLGIAVQQKLTLDEVSRWDLIYAPPFAPLWDPVLIAAHQAQKNNP